MTTGVRTLVPVLGIPIAVTDMEQALQLLQEDLQADRKGYVCFASVHGIMEAKRQPSFARVYAESALCLPDGAPVSWVGRWQGHRSMRRVAGPDFMLKVFADERFRTMTHFFYGGEEGVAATMQRNLQQRYPHARIVGTYTPPFRSLNEVEEQELQERIQKLQPDFFWVGIGCPKQEYFMHQYVDRLETRMMFGVGAAFDYHSGRIDDSPEWVKLAGLQWLHRLAQDPRRLWKRYLYSNSAFLWNLALQATGLEQVKIPMPVEDDLAAERAIHLVERPRM
ncbi:exopolysaccharide biosynthesis protein, WecB/TagA/CpsF family [Terriglobus roseus DSM 18391]|uniref:Exopolysaccharide biosynthesis protein, WecB/TagA/CpsF family n=1 Tax=Terriglobus roseus (strain DSM 18391 / NRRL B-41598 / KBS 63) TaxID=926566 RepID=I3ZE42_TERRK|nr:WecB/TagA/CpsF family glycosyltransferase [Terriglobus roseus]AFL87510.1 exopolysaccharide biosynthesis protein, WecB/TagA/CpsF family [Terriglobus roseus DSM 18391]